MRILPALVGAMIIAFTSNAQSRNVTSSWYGAHWNGRLTANGEVFNSCKLTVAHRTLPLGTKVMLTHGKHKVVARVNDRGPYVRGRGLDVSEAVAQRLGFRHQGVARVNMRVLKKK